MKVETPAIKRILETGSSPTCFAPTKELNTFKSWIYLLRENMIYMINSLSDTSLSCARMHTHTHTRENITINKIPHLWLFFRI